MIQRIQTIYLGIAFIASVLLFLFPIHSYSANIIDVIAILILALVTGLILISIFMFKKITLQIKFVAVAFLLKVIYVAIIYSASDIEILNLSSLFSFIILAMLFLSNKAIKSDEEKLKESNRIR